MRHSSDPAPGDHKEVLPARKSMSRRRRPKKKAKDAEGVMPSRPRDRLATASIAAFGRCGPPQLVPTEHAHVVG